MKIQAIFLRLLLGSFTTLAKPIEGCNFTFTLIIILPIILLTGCFYSVHDFGEEVNSSNTELERELRKVNHSGWCLSTNTYKELGMFGKNLKIMENQMNQTFQRFFPISTPLQQITNKLASEIGANCSTQPDALDKKLSHIRCAYSLETTYGREEFSITGWEITLMQWRKDNFEFDMTAKDNLLVSSQGRVLEGECSEIDKTAYETSKAIKFTRKIP